MPLDAVAHRSRTSQRALLLTAALAGVLLFVLAAAAAPATTLGASSSKVALCNAYLRSTASTGSRIRKLAHTGTSVTVAATVTGRSYATDCAGKRVSGRTWIRVTAINGKSVKSLLGVTSVYAAAGLFKTVPVTRYAACPAYLRSSAKAGSRALSKVKLDAMLTVVATVSGRSYDTTCSGKAVAGSSWARVSAVNGKSVRSLFGVSYVYVASKLLAKERTVAAESEPPAPGTLEGLDVSHWQNAIDWIAVAGAGKSFTYMKASEDTDFVDWNYEINRARRERGRAGRRGLSLRSARRYGRGRRRRGGPFHRHGEAGVRRPDPGPRSRAERRALTDRAERLGPRLSRARRGTPRGPRRDLLLAELLEERTWATRRGSRTTATRCCGSPTGRRPRTRPCLAAHWGANGWTFWQYTSSGVVPGIAGRVDLNRYNGTDLSAVRIP